MEKITFNKTFVDVAQKDLQNFISMLIQESKFDEGIYITVLRHLRIDNVDLMTNITIEFVTYNQNTELNERWEWKSYRAKDFSCANNSFNKCEQFKN